MRIAEGEDLPGGLRESHQVRTRSLFQEAWWWDAIAPGQWDEVTITRGRHTVAGLRFLRYRAPLGMTRLAQPQFTRWAGPWMDDTDAKMSSRLSRETKLIAELIDKLPHHDHFAQALHPEAYWLPFRWAGFALEPMVTYRLAPPESDEALWLGFDERIRRAIRKARKSLEVTEETGAGRLIDTAQGTYGRQRQPLPLPAERIEQLVETTVRQQAGTVLSAVDGQGKAHAALFLTWDAQRMYYVIGGGNPDLRMSGAASLLLLQALQTARQRSLEFDFAGSVIESIERFFRAFGARPVTYVRVSRSSRRYRAYRALRSGLKRARD